MNGITISKEDLMKIFKERDKAECKKIGMIIGGIVLVASLIAAAAVLIYKKLNEGIDDFEDDLDDDDFFEDFEAEGTPAKEAAAEKAPEATTKEVDSEEVDSEEVTAEEADAADPDDIFEEEDSSG